MNDVGRSLCSGNAFPNLRSADLSCLDLTLEMSIALISGMKVVISEANIPPMETPITTGFFALTIGAASLLAYSLNRSFFLGVNQGMWVCRYPSSLMLSNARWSAPRPEMKNMCGFELML